MRKALLWRRGDWIRILAASRFPVIAACTERVNSLGGDACATQLALRDEMMNAMTISYLFPPGDSLFPLEQSQIIELAIDSTAADVSKSSIAVKRNTKAIGDISEVMVIAALARNGFLVSVPFGENHRYDLIADDGTQLLRIQVKTGRLRDGAINFACCSSHQHRRSGPTATRPYFGQIEYLAVYCPANGKVYLVPESELVATYGHLRLEPARNRQTRNIRWACEYELA